MFLQENLLTVITLEYVGKINVFRLQSLNYLSHWEINASVRHIIFISDVIIVKQYFVLV